jgi:hypothetical protein
MIVSSALNNVLAGASGAATVSRKISLSTTPAINQQRRMRRSGATTVIFLLSPPPPAVSNNNVRQIEHRVKIDDVKVERSKSAITSARSGVLISSSSSS